MTDRKQKVAAIDAALTRMFHTLEARGVPEHLQNVVDQLDGAAQAEGAPIGVAVDDVTPCPPRSSSPEP